jgi:hypothetical protein
MSAPAAEKQENAPTVVAEAVVTGAVVAGTAVAAATIAPGIVGYIDAVNANCVYGWAWDRSAPQSRVEIIVSAQGRELGTAVASQLREDLRASGIGDGAHAFEFVIPDGIDPAALEVRARRPGSEEAVALAPRGAPPGASGDAVAPLLEALLRSQRLLHRNLQSALLAKQEQPSVAVEAPKGAVAALEATQEALQRQIDGVEIFLVRLDEQLRAMTIAVNELKNRGGDRVTQIMLGFLGAISAASLALGFARFIG